jgi:hypothetical protein
VAGQPNKPLMLFEEAVGIEAARRNTEHLGTWNISIQSNNFDGVHLDMVLNWLNMLTARA